MDYSSVKYPNNYYYKGPTNLRQNRTNANTNTEYGYINRRSTQSIHPLWQDEGIPSKSQKSRGKICSVVLAVASFFVVLAVLSIAGMALYMGVFHDAEPTTNKNLLNFSCSAKISRGDRFIGKYLQEKARRYRLQFETLYKRSVLGPSLVSCVVEKFGNDTFTVYFKLTLDKTKIHHLNSVEKTIRDILITDAISRKPVFRTVRFDQKSIRVNSLNDFQTAQRNTLTHLKTKRPNITNQSDKKKSGVVRGSFKISKTDADITDTEANAKDRTTTNAKERTTTKRPVAVTTAYKIGAIEKVNRTNAPTTIIVTTTRSTTTSTTSEQPWIPIVSTTEAGTTTTQSREKPQPVYTSFTNPGLSYHFFEKESLGSSNLKSHPIPVNKLPNVESSTTPLRREFVQVETVKHIPGSGEVAVKNDGENLGQGQVEVVDEAEETLMMQTTKLPLVTLLPVKSNSGIGRPLRKRPDGSYASDRSFPDQVALGVNLTDFNVMSVLNFDTSEDGRNPKMNTRNDSDVIVAVYATNSSVSSNHNIDNILSPEKLVQLSEISTVHNGSRDPIVISNKAISSNSHFQMLTKTYHKVESAKNSTAAILETECDNTTIKCGDGQCLPATARCNQLIDCKDGKDEKNCNCADYLKSQYLVRKICDGIVDCWDYSDENECDWCTPDKYVCGNSKVCVDQSKICNGIKDCPQGDDEQQCVTIAKDLNSASEVSYKSEGTLIIKKNGLWGKMCAENLFPNTEVPSEIQKFGRIVCKSLSYETLETIHKVRDEEPSSRFYHQVKNTSVLSFESTQCLKKEILHLKCSDLECGTRPHAAKNVARRYRIVGGGNAGLGSWPWQAAMYKEGEFQCGATLISDLWLLSAGHCFHHSQDEYWVARLGALRRGTSLPSPYEQLRKITKILVHPGYVDSGFINDISLLRMEKRVLFSDFVRPICLPVQEMSDGQICTVVGWGQLFEVGRIFPDTLQEVQVPVISTEECRKRTAFLPLYKITDDMFCAGYERGGRDACLGDSGGPLMCPQTNGKWVIQGITSNGYGCARANRPGVYTKVSKYLNWMHVQMEDDSSAKPSKSVCHGHRCPLGECLPKSRLCNGFIECSDASDEKQC